MPARSTFAPSSLDIDTLLAGARQLQRACGGASVRSLLNGKILGLVCESEESDEARSFRDAATALGARVTHIRLGAAQLDTSDDETLAHTARVLGRLYDGIECQGLPRPLVDRLRRDAGVPVFDGLASATHPTAPLVEKLAVAEPAETRRRLILQAALLHSLLALEPTRGLSPGPD